MKKFTNLTTALILLNYMAGKTRKVHELHGGKAIVCEHMTDEDVAYYVEKKKIKVEEVKKTPPPPPEAIVLPEGPTAELLRTTFTVPQLRQYCKEQEPKLVVPTGSKEDDIVEIILASLESKE